MCVPLCLSSPLLRSALTRFASHPQDLKKETFADIPIDTRYRRKRLMKNGKLRRNITLANYPQEWLPAQAQQQQQAQVEAPAQEKAQA